MEEKCVPKYARNKLIKRISSHSFEPVFRPSSSTFFRIYLFSNRWLRVSNLKRYIIPERYFSINSTTSTDNKILVTEWKRYFSAFGHCIFDSSSQHSVICFYFSVLWIFYYSEELFVSSFCFPSFDQGNKFYQFALPLRKD